MPVRPQLMVLYTNDAVEVRYTDGSRLHILPCATSFTYSLPRDDAHPAIGMEMVTQRCAYVTSIYRDMLLAALDFRNRFAERPFLCEDLCEPDQVVHLYAKIKDIAWPKVCSPDNCELQEDGSVCITSTDEFGSLILSPHQRDFTVCYLSPLSQDKCREKIKIRKNDSSNPKDKNSSKQTSCKSVEKKSIKDEKQKVFTGNSNVLNDNSSERKWNEGLCSPRRKTDKTVKDDLNISPITQASFIESPRAMSNASGSPVTPQDAVKDRDAMFRPFSTPTEGLENDPPSSTPYDETSGTDQYTKGNNPVRLNHNTNNNGSFLDTLFRPISADKKINGGGQAMTKEGNKGSNVDKIQLQLDNISQVHSDHEDHTLVSRGCHSNSSLSSSDSCQGDRESKTRCKYTWLTRHISCDECPIDFNSIVKMATEIAQHGLQQAGHDKDSKHKKRSTDISKLRQIDRKCCQMSETPLALPLSCPGQHLHKTQSKQSYDDGKNPLEDPTTFSQGRLKVLLIDGVIYRIVRLPTIRLVEVYPGDGSVLISQGMSAHFFLHVIPHGSQLEERTYSIKSPPPSTKGSYSVKNLINRAHRFLGYIRQEETTLPASVGLCCWKHEELVLSEPTSTTVLEECTIQGYGKFTALSNGQIRVAFTDRTCLDMTCDFTRRLSKCQDQSNNSGALQNSHTTLTDKKAGTCRLLLPNGQYQMINVEHPGTYKRYIDIAKEWIEWVNSSPAQRQKFYSEKADKNMNMSVERELQKIQCFNYIVDNTLLKKSSDSQNTSSGATTRPSILRSSERNKHKNNQNSVEHVHRTVQIHSPPSMSSRSTSRSFLQTSMPNPNVRTSLIGSSGSFLQSSIPSQSVRTSLIGSSYVSSSIPNERPTPIGQSSVSCDRQATPTMFEGFNSVREALMRTSNVIKDLDKILEKR